MDNQTGNKSEQTYRCQNEVDVECSLFLHDYYMLGLAGTVRGSTWTIYGFAEVGWRYSCCFRKEPGKVSVIFKSEFLSYFLYAFTGIYQAPFGSCHNFILYVLADTEPRHPFYRFVEIHE